MESKITRREKKEKGRNFGDKEKRGAEARKAKDAEKEKLKRIRYEDRKGKKACNIDMKHGAYIIV